jgi:hypothetical protein
MIRITVRWEECPVHRCSERARGQACGRKTRVPLPKGRNSSATGAQGVSERPSVISMLRARSAVVAP